ncbi:hypothetical protein D3C72_2550830 [compost metagenome]
MGIFTSLDTDGINERSCSIMAFNFAINFRCSSLVTDWPLTMRPYTLAHPRNALARL